MKTKVRCQLCKQTIPNGQEIYLLFGMSYGPWCQRCLQKIQDVRSNPPRIVGNKVYPS